MAFNIEQFREKIIQAIQSADVGEIVLGILKIPKVSNVIYNDDRVQEFAPKFRDIAITPTPPPHLTGNLTTLPTVQAFQGNRPVLYSDDTSPSAAGKRSASGDEGHSDNPRAPKCIRIDDGK